MEVVNSANLGGGLRIDQLVVGGTFTCIVTVTGGTGSFASRDVRCWGTADENGHGISFADSADGPAFFVMFIAGSIVAGAALAVEVLYAPPYWVHALLWGPLILITTLLPLRPIKGLLIALQYHHKAAEGRFTGGDAP